MYNQTIREAILHSNINNPDFIIMLLDHLVTTEHHFIAPYEPKPIPKNWYICLNVLIKNKTGKRFTGDFLIQLCDLNGSIVATSRIKKTIPAKNPIDLFSEWLPIESAYGHAGLFKVFFNGKKLCEYEYDL